ncbi:hypothetical protein CHISP_3714 [Chitinispirillum alkaliphilum]|nr:hypothetical protein CHISP_3714 [Chitinispirillum alkaliphilum]
MQVNDKFPVLSTVAKIVNALGWGAVIIGAISLISAIFAIISNSGGTQELEQQILMATRYTRLIAGISTIVGGFITIAFAEVIGVFFAIEKNTREPIDFSNLTGELFRLIKSETANHHQGNVTTTRPVKNSSGSSKLSENIVLTSDELVKKEELIKTLAENEVVVINKNSRLLMKMSKANVNDIIWKVLYPVEV